jgi:hypothetical protein
MNKIAFGWYRPRSAQSVFLRRHDHGLPRSPAVHDRLDAQWRLVPGAHETSAQHSFPSGNNQTSINQEKWLKINWFVSIFQAGQNLFQNLQNPVHESKKLNYFHVLFIFLNWICFLFIFIFLNRKIWIGKQPPVCSKACTWLYANHLSSFMPRLCVH